MIRTWLLRSGLGATLAALAVAFGAGSLLAQTSRVEGTVRNAQTGDPIAGARVTVVGTELAATTNQNGYYAIENVPVGTYSVRVTVIGFQSATITNQVVAAGLPTTVNFSLNPSILRIEGVVVTGVAERTEVVKLPFTVDQISGEDLPVPASSAEESIRGKVAGARVIRGEGTPGESAVSVLLRGPTSINTSGRSNEPLYVVDGVILGEQSMVDIDALEIESIEVVKGAAAAALYGARAANGVVSITTRRGRDIPEGETRVTFRSEFGVNNIENEIPLGQSHWYQTDGTNWLGRVVRGGKNIDSAVAANDRARASRLSSSCWLTDPLSLADTTCGRSWRPYDARDTATADLNGDGTPETYTYIVRDNPYPSGTTLYNQLDRFYDPGQFYNHSMSVSHRTGSTNFLASFHESKETGVVNYLNGYLRRGARVNVDHQLGGAFDFSVSAYYTNSQRDGDAQGGGAGDPFYDINFFPQDVDLLEREISAQTKVINGVATRRDSNDFLIQPDPLVVQGNPIYTVANLENDFRRSRILGNIRLRWRPVQVFDIESEFSYDRADANTTQYWFKGFKTLGSSEVNDGKLYKANNVSQAINWSATAAYNGDFGDFGAIVKARALLERASGRFFDATALDLAVDDVRRMDLGDPARNRVSSFIDDIRSLGFFLSTQLDYKDRYIFDGLIRRDGSSLFGAEERWQNYYRISGAWRMAQEPWWPLPVFDEFKLRASEGTAGGRPQFSAQYETFSVSGGLISKGVLGNRFLKPEFAKEREFGLDFLAFGRLSGAITYARSEVKDQILLVPLAGYFGFSDQWRNAGTLLSKTWEGTLQWAVFQNPTFTWQVNFVIDRTRQRITAYETCTTDPTTGTETCFPLPTDKTGTGGVDAFFIRKNEELGQMYGHRWAKECRDIYDATTKVFPYRVAGQENACYVQNGGGYQVNDDGYLVPVGTGRSYTDKLYGARITIDGVTYDWGLPFYSWDTVTNPATGLIDTVVEPKMGKTQPDFNWGLGNTFRWKGLSLYVLFDAQVGGDIYNNTRQWAARENNIWETDQSGKAEGDKKPLTYYQRLYDTNQNNSHYVEDGSYIKLRELSLRYTIGRNTLEPLFGNFVKRVTLSLVGRNLLTWTDYLGYDPEVSTSNSEGVIYRVDAFEYPNYRTITGAVEIEF